MSLNPADCLPIVDKVRRLPDGKLLLAMRVPLQGEAAEWWPTIKITLPPDDFNSQQSLEELAIQALQKAAEKAVIAFRQLRC